MGFDFHFGRTALRSVSPVWESEDGRQKMNTLFYAIGIVVFVMLIVTSVKSYCKRLSGGCCGGGGSKAVHADRVTDRDPAHYPFVYVLTLDGMVCANCANTVANALNALPGVWAAVELSKKQARVRMKKRLSQEMLREAVRAAGPYTVLSAEEVSA